MTTRPPPPASPLRRASFLPEGSGASRSYWRLERLGWGFYFRHLQLVTRSVWKADLAPLRVLLGAVSLSLGLFFLMPTGIVALGSLIDWLNGPAPWPGWLPRAWKLYANPGYRFIDAWTLGREWLLGVMFVVQGFGMVWRVYAPSHRPLWGYLFAGVGVTLYVGFPLAVCLDLGRLTGQSVAMFWLGFGHAWCGKRVGSGEDRAGA